MVRDFLACRLLYFLSIEFSWTGGPLWVGSYFGLVMHGLSGESRCSPSAARGAGRFFWICGSKNGSFSIKNANFLGGEIGKSDPIHPSGGVPTRNHEKSSHACDYKGGCSQGCFRSSVRPSVRALFILSVDFA